MADTKQTKTIGEHWVASELARRGWAPALTRDGLERTDILAVKADGLRRQIEVQVKAARGTGAAFNWPIGKKAQLPPAHDAEWFVLALVDDDVSKPLRGLVMPRAHVAAVAWMAHMHWLTEPGVPKGQRNAGVDRSRVFLRDVIHYEGRWDLLDQSAYEAPVLLPARYRDLAQDPRVGLPAVHPWLIRLPDWN
ncbi:hypothetical protein ACSHWG_12230 [Leucobacter sp. Z1108]|uniref:hypothetical protein n=1 Tax=Leucobacter sp. Z1108 TaxID=3439066 RepID=UPI003F349B09